MSRASVVRTFLAVAIAATLSSRALAQAGALHWKKISPEGGTVLALALDPRAPLTMYAGLYGGGVFKTVDGASSWNSASVGLSGRRVFSLALDPTREQILYTGTNKGIFKSSDGGATWSFSGGTAVNTFTQSLPIDPKNPQTIYAGTSQGVFKSTDEGTTWVTAGAGVAAAAITIDPTTALTVVVVGTDAESMRTRSKARAEEATGS